MHCRRVRIVLLKVAVRDHSVPEVCTLTVFEWDLHREEWLVSWATRAHLPVSRRPHHWGDALLPGRQLKTLHAQRT
eukprot:1064703-Prorocentrum_minimum.AAC.1